MSRIQRFGFTGGALVGVVTVIGLASLLWPFFISASASANQAHAHDAPFVLLLMVPVLLGLTAIEMSRGGIDARGIAVLGILAACGTALRIPSPGVAGLEPVFFLLVLAGYVYGAPFGFALGGLTLFVSAIATGGVGPWLPFQMLAAGWVGAGAGALPHFSLRRERFALAAYGAVACLGYGMAMNLWFWPAAVGTMTSVSYVPGGSLEENLLHFLAFDLTTSMGFDLPRAALNAALIVAVGKPVLVALRRTARRTVALEPFELLTEPVQA
jgi:energy-coupling factor transport system substrate-specific component